MIWPPWPPACGSKAGRYFHSRAAVSANAAFSARSLTATAASPRATSSRPSRGRRASRPGHRRRHETEVPPVVLTGWGVDLGFCGLLGWFVLTTPGGDGGRRRGGRRPAVAAGWGWWSW